MKNYADLGGNILLNPSTTDGCREGAWWNWRELQASAEGKHDNPVSCNHQAPSHWEPQWKNAQILTKTHPEGRESWGQKSAKATTHESNVGEMIDQQKCCKIAKAQDRPHTWRPLARIVLCLTSPELHLTIYNIFLGLHNSSRWM